MPGEGDEAASTNKDEQCHLLRLPLELRQLIYSHSTSEINISRGSESEVTLDNAIIPQLSRLNRQIHDECCEFSKHGLRLEINCTALRTSLEATFVLKSDFPKKILQGVDDIEIWYAWQNFTKGDHIMAKWMWENSLEEHRGQNGTVWTPTKGFVMDCQQFLTSVRPLVSERACIDINIDLDGFPDPDLPLSIGTFCRYFLPVREVSTRYSYVVHTPTISKLGLHGDRQDSWPLQGHLDVAYWLTTTLFCTPEDKSEELMRNRRSHIGFGDWKAGEMMQPGFYLRPSVCWKLIPTTDEGSYRGFEATFIASDEDEVSVEKM